MAASICEYTSHNPEITQGLAMVRDIQLCLNLGIYHLIVESDCQLLVKKIQSQDESLSFGGNIIHDVKSLMTHFYTCSVHFSHRQSNITTHKLARFACNVHNIVFWYGVTPGFCLESFGMINNHVCKTDFLCNAILPLIKRNERKPIVYSTSHHMPLWLTFFFFYY